MGMHFKCFRISQCSFLLVSLDEVLREIFEFVDIVFLCLLLINKEEFPFLGACL